MLISRNRGRAVAALAVLALVALSWAPSSQCVGQQDTNVRRGFPWKIPIPSPRKGGGGIGFLLDVDNRLTAYSLRDADADSLWNFEMSLGKNAYVYTSLPIAKVRGKDTLFLLDKEGYLFSVDVRTGEPNWRTYKGQEFAYPPVVLKDWLIVVSKDGRIYKLDASTGKPAGRNRENPAFWSGDPVIARPVVIMDMHEKEPAFVVALTQSHRRARIGERRRHIWFLNFQNGLKDDRFSGPVKDKQLASRRVSAPLFATGSFDRLGSSTMKIFIAVRRGNNEVIYFKDYSQPHNAFKEFHTIRGGKLCEKPVFTNSGYVILPNTSGQLIVLRSDGAPLNTIDISEQGDPMSVQLIEKEKQSYGVMLVQTVNSLAAYRVNFRPALSAFGPQFAFSVYAWPIRDAQATPKWDIKRTEKDQAERKKKTSAYEYLGPPRLPLKDLSDKVLYTSQVGNTAWLAVFNRRQLIDEKRTTAPSPLYVRRSGGSGAAFLSLDPVNGAARMLVGYGDLGVYVVDCAGRKPERIYALTSVDARLVMNVPDGMLIFSEDDEGPVMRMVRYETRFMSLHGRTGRYVTGMKPFSGADKSGVVFRENTGLVSTRPIVVNNTVYYTTMSAGVEKRELSRLGRLVSLPVRALSPLTHHDGVLLVGTRNKTLQAINARELKKLWSLPIEGAIHAAPTVAEDHIYAAADNGLLYVLPFRSPRGHTLRNDGASVKLGCAGVVYAPPLKIGDKLYVAAVGERGWSFLVQFDLSRGAGKPKLTEWSRKILGEIRQPMVACRGKLVAATSNRILVYDNAAGNKPRQVKVVKLVDDVASPPRVVGSDVCFVCRNGAIYFVKTEED